MIKATVIGFNGAEVGAAIDKLNLDNVKVFWSLQDILDHYGYADKVDIPFINQLKMSSALLTAVMQDKELNAIIAVTPNTGKVFFHTTKLNYMSEFAYLQEYGGKFVCYRNRLNAPQDKEIIDVGCKFGMSAEDYVKRYALSYKPANRGVFTASEQSIEIVARELMYLKYYDKTFTEHIEFELNPTP